MELKRVVVTGLGAVTPVGNTPEETWENLLAGKSGAAPITHFDTTNFKTKFACEVKDLNINEWIDRKEARKLDRYTQLAMIAAMQGVKDANIDLETEDLNNVGVVFGVGIVMHTYFAFIVSYAGLYLIRYFKIKGSIYFVILFIFSLAMMTESVWVIGTDMQKDTVIRNISSTYLSHDIYVDKVMVNDIDFMDRYGGYLDIGLYDTIGDMICTVVGSFIFIVIMKKRLNC